MPSTRSGFLTPNQQQPIGNYGQQRRSLWDRIGGALSGVGRGVGAVGGGITDMLAAAGGAYAPADLDLNKMQQIGLLGNTMRDMQYGPGAPTSPQAQTYLDRIRRQNEFARINQERTDLQDAITNSSLLTQPMKDLYSNAPMEQQQGLLNDISSRNYGAGARSTFGTGQQIFLDTTTQQRKVGQLGSAGGILLDGVLYNAPGSPPLPPHYQYLGTTLAYDPENVGAVARAGAEGEVVGETMGLLERYNHPDFTQDEGAYQATIAQMVAQAESDVRLEEGIKTAKIDRLNGLLDDFNTSWSRTQSQEQQTERMNELIDRSLDQSGFWTTGFMGSLLDGWPGSPAYDLAHTVMTLEANLGFDKLQAMRAASPTGGALGQVSERELALLTSAIANLKTSQSRSQFEANLRIVKEMTNQTWKNIDDAFIQDYGISYFDADAKGTVTQFIESEQQRILSGEPRPAGITTPDNNPNPNSGRFSVLNLPAEMIQRLEAGGSLTPLEIEGLDQTTLDTLIELMSSL